MITKIILEVVAGCATLMFGNMFWTVHRRKHFIGMIFDNPSMLARVVTSELLRVPPSSIARFMPPGSGGYASMASFLEADQIAQRGGQIFVGMLTIGIVLASSFLGLVCFVINILLFVLLRLGPPGQIAREQAVLWVQTIAFLLWRWHSLNPNECAASVAQMKAPDLVTLQSHLAQLEP